MPEGQLPRTPLLLNPHISRELGCDVYIKYENLMPIGAFKVRGGAFLAASLTEDEKRRGDHRRLNREPRSVSGIWREAGGRALRHRDAGGGEPA